MSQSSIHIETNSAVILDNIHHWINRVCEEGEAKLAHDGEEWSMGAIGYQLAGDFALRDDFVSNFLARGHGGIDEGTRRFLGGLLVAGQMTDGSVYVLDCEGGVDDEGLDFGEDESGEMDYASADSPEVVEVFFDDEAMASIRLEAIRTCAGTYARLGAAGQAHMQELIDHVYEGPETISALTAYMGGDRQAIRTRLPMAAFRSLARVLTAGGDAPERAEADATTPLRTADTQPEDEVSRGKKRGKAKSEKVQLSFDF